jgi:hypothetical protein
MTIQIAGSNCRLYLAERPPLQMGSKSGVIMAARGSKGQ